MRVQSIRWKIARRHLNQPRPHRLRWVLAFILVLLVALSGGTGAAAMYFVAHLPSIDKFRVQYAFQNARIFDSQGHLLFNMADLSKNGGRRVVEPLQDRYDTLPACRGGTNRIPVILQNATIATEDATFYKNPGFDAMSILRAAYQNFQSGSIVSGASTITQQVVRAELLNRARTLDRKAQEIALAYEISRKFSKREILSYYLNSVPYGNLAIGAEAGAEVYFHRRVCSIDQAQAAFLAGLPRAPSEYDPVHNRPAAMRRLAEVLGLMRKHGYLRTRAQVTAALAEAQSWRFSPPSTFMRYPQFVRYVIDQLKASPTLRGQLFTGIDVYTTLDSRLQDLAQTAVTTQINTLRDTNNVGDGALVSLDLRPPHYGWIMAMVGSANYADKTGQINMAISPRQPGSSMKPFNYIYAFQHGVGPATQVLDLPVQLPDPNDTQHGGWYVPQNYDHLVHGALTVRQALANSLNLPAVKVEYYVTNPSNVARTAYKFGMSSLYKDNPGLDCSVCYSVTLGGLARGTRLLEETAAYGAFATGGLTVPPVAIWKVIKRSTHSVLYCAEDCGHGAKPAQWLLRARHRVVDPAHAYEMTNVLSDNASRCVPQVCEFGLNSPLVLSHPTAAKTGTTNDFTDNWTLGYTPQIVTGVWTGNADHTPMVNVIGITGAAPIWHQFMEGAFSILRLPSLPFVAPPNVIQSTQCRAAGSSATSIGAQDIYVRNDALPLCQIPDRGPMPVSCANYPQPLPPSFQCRYQTGFQYTGVYTPTQRSQYPFNSDTSPP